MRDESRAAADTERGDRRGDRRPARMADLATDETHRPLGETRDEAAVAGAGLIDKIIDDEVAARADRQRGLVMKHHLERSAARCPNPFFRDDVAADLERLGAAARGRAGRR